MFKDKKIIVLEKSIFNTVYNNLVDALSKMGTLKNIDQKIMKEPITLDESVKIIKALAKYVDYVNSCVIGNAMKSMSSHYSFGMPSTDNSWLSKLTREEIKELSDVITEEIEAFKDDDAISRIINRNKVNLLNAAQMEMRRRKDIEEHSSFYNNMFNSNISDGNSYIHNYNYSNTFNSPFSSMHDNLNRLIDIAELTDSMLMKNDKDKKSHEPVIMDYCNRFDNLEFVTNKENVKAEMMDDIFKRGREVVKSKNVTKDETNVYSVDTSKKYGYVYYVEVDSDEEIEIIKNNFDVIFDVLPISFFKPVNNDSNIRLIPIINPFKNIDLLKDELSKLLGKNIFNLKDSMVTVDATSNLCIDKKFKSGKTFTFNKSGKTFTLNFLETSEAIGKHKYSYKINIENKSKNIEMLNNENLLLLALSNYAYDNAINIIKDTGLIKYELFVANQNAKNMTDLIEISASIIGPIGFFPSRDMLKPFIKSVESAFDFLKPTNDVKLISTFHDADGVIGNVLDFIIVDSENSETTTEKESNENQDNSICPEPIGVNVETKMLSDVKAHKLYNYNFLNVNNDNVYFNGVDKLDNIYFVQLKNQTEEFELLKNYISKNLYGVKSSEVFFIKNKNGEIMIFMAVKYDSIFNAGKFSREYLQKDLSEVLRRDVVITYPEEILSINDSFEMSKNFTVLNRNYDRLLNKIDFKIPADKNMDSSLYDIFIIYLMYSFIFHTHIEEDKKHEIKDISLNFKIGDNFPTILLNVYVDAEIHIKKEKEANAENNSKFRYQSYDEYDNSLTMEYLKPFLYGVQETFREMRIRHKTSIQTISPYLEYKNNNVHFNFKEVVKKNTNYTKMKNIGYGIDDVDSKMIEDVFKHFNITETSRLFILPLSPICNSKDIEKICNILDTVNDAECNVIEYHISKQFDDIVNKYYILINFDYNKKYLPFTRSPEEIGRLFKKKYLDKIDKKYLL